MISKYGLMSAIHQTHCKGKTAVLVRVPVSTGLVSGVYCHSS